MIFKSKKIRFNKRDIQSLDAFPSSEAGAIHAALQQSPQNTSPVARVKKRKKFLFRCCRFFLSALIVLTLLTGGAFLFLRAGISSEMLRQEAQQRLQDILGPKIQARIAQAQISLDGNHHLALEAKDVSLLPPTDPDQAVTQGMIVEAISAVRLGLSPLALMAGNIEVSQIELDGAKLRLPQGNKESAALIQLPFDARGLVDFDLLSKEVFQAVEETLTLLDHRQTKTVIIRNTLISFTVLGEDQQLLIERAKLSQQGLEVSLQASALWQGQSVDLSASILRDQTRNHVADFKVAINGIPLDAGSPEEVLQVMANDRPNPAYFHISGRANIELRGNAVDAESAGELQPGAITRNLAAHLQVLDATVEMGRIRNLKGDLSVELEHLQGADKLEVKTSKLNLGGLSAQFTGAFGPEPELVGAASSGLPVDIGDTQALKPGYRFELVTRDAVSAPQGSNEAALPFAVKIAGRLMQDAMRIDFNALDVQTNEGELYGQGRMIFGGGSPAMIFMLRVPTMPVAHAKQLWPLNVADGGRDWVLKNLFGGRIFDSQIDIALPAGHFNGPGLPPELTASDIKVDFNVEATRFDVIGEIPAVRDANGTIAVRGAHTTINLTQGTAYTAANRQINLRSGTLVIPWGPQRPVLADLDLDLQGDAAAMTELVGYKPINAMQKLPFTADDLSGDVTAQVKMQFSVTKGAPKDSLQWQAELAFNDVDLKKPFNGQIVNEAKGTLSVNDDVAKINATARLNNIPAHLALTEPLGTPAPGKTPVKRVQNIKLVLDDKTRAAFYPELNQLFKGTLVLELGEAQDKIRRISADLSKTTVSLPWLGWKKGAGIAAKATMDVKLSDAKDTFSIRNLDFSGSGFQVRGDLDIVGNRLQSANIRRLSLTRTDNLSLEVSRSGNGYRADVKGKAFDARALLQQTVSASRDQVEMPEGAGGGSIPRIVVNAHIDEVKGFHDQSLRDVTISYETSGAKLSGVSLNALIGNNNRISATSNNQKGASSVALQSSDAGAILRFFDFYDKMHGGKISVNLTSQGKGPLYGTIDARNFSIINEPRMAKMVSSGSNGGKSLNQAVRKKIDVSRVDFERGSAQVEKGTGYVSLRNGVVRGPMIGTTFQGILYDRNNNMAITGTFMPAYGLNRLFGELPLLGAILGNGRDRGLIGITFKLAGNADEPEIIVNPISVIAPGIFRSIFEFQ